MLRLILLLLFPVFVNAQTTIVYKTPSGKKYHTANCSTVKNVSEAITVSEAVQLGLEPCKVCKPVVVMGSGSKTPQGQSATVQCKGLTKAGTRCKHMTKIANGYCFQHQP